MAEFMGDIAFILEVALLCAGLLVWDYGKRQGAGLVKISAAIMVAAGLGAGICTTYYWFSYMNAGAFATAYPVPMQSSGTQMGPGMMNRMMHGGQMPMGSGQDGAMMNQMMQGGEMPLGGQKSGQSMSGESGATAPNPQEHEQHHEDGNSNTTGQAAPPTPVAPIRPDERGQLEKMSGEHPM